MFDVTVGGALLAGLLSFLSPCILPMVPFYLSYLAGTGAQSAGGGAGGTSRGRAIAGAVLFALGIITVFVALGASASVAGQFMRDWFGVLRWVAAAVIIAMGLHFLGVFRIGILYRQVRADVGDVKAMSLPMAYVIGLAFAFGWTPCVGPVLAAILFMAGGQESAGQGAWLLFAYGLGMTLPFIVAAAFVVPFQRFMQRFRRHLGTVEKVMGAMLVLFGVLIATNSINVIAQWMIETFPVFLSIG